MSPPVRRRTSPFVEERDDVNDFRGSETPEDERTGITVVHDALGHVRVMTVVKSAKEVQDFRSFVDHGLILPGFLGKFHCFIENVLNGTRQMLTNNGQAPGECPSPGQVTGGGGGSRFTFHNDVPREACTPHRPRKALRGRMYRPSILNDLVVFAGLDHLSFGVLEANQHWDDALFPDTLVD